MNEKVRKYGRIDFETLIQLIILEPYMKKAYMEDASVNGLRMVTELDLDLSTKLTCKNTEIENSIPFKAKVVWKKPLESGLFRYGLYIEE